MNRRPPTANPASLLPLIQRWQQGDADAGDVLFQRVVHELKAMAAGLLRNERPEHTLQPTALVSELYLKLLNLRDLEVRDRTHFLSLSARAMRQILVDHARTRRAKKRGADWVRTQIDPIAAVGADPVDVLVLEAALDTLETIDPRRARFVELRFYGGLTVDESAEVLGLSTRTAKRHWRATRAWLADFLTTSSPSEVV